MQMNEFTEIIKDAIINRTMETKDYKCQYCGKKLPTKELNMDHVIPRDRGGGTSWENVVISCIRCNSKKSNRLPKEAGMRLLKEPKRPSRRQEISWHKIICLLQLTCIKEIRN